MLKIKFFILAFVLISVSQVFAVNGDIFTIPNIHDSWSNLIGVWHAYSADYDFYRDDTYLDWYGRLKKWFSCRIISSPYTETDQLQFESVWYADVYLTGWYVYLNIKKADWSYATWNITPNLSTLNSWGSHPTDFVFCSVIDTQQIFPWNALWLDTWSFFYSYQYWLYNSWTLILNDKLYLTWTTEFWLKMYWDWNLYWSTRGWARRDPYPWTYTYSWYLQYPSYNAIDFKNISIKRQKIISAFLTWTTETIWDVRIPLGYIYGSTWVMWIDVIWWGWGGWTDYFAKCTSFIDVWCYVKATWLTVQNWLLSFFPDINWTWQSYSCTSTGSMSPIWYSWSSHFIQNVVNFLAIISPFPPSEWNNVCLVWGTLWDGMLWSSGWIEVIHYQHMVHEESKMSNWYTFFDVFIIIIIWMWIIWTFRKSHTWNNSWPQQTTWLK